jgi:hypothetical protein
MVTTDSLRLGRGRDRPDPSVPPMLCFWEETAAVNDLVIAPLKRVSGTVNMGDEHMDHAMDMIK